MLEQEERTRRIVATAVELAEEGGFEAVRMRDVAAHAGVALGTFYKRFRSKEDLLVAALELESERLGRRISKKMSTEGTRLERVLGFFDLATKGLTKKPNLAKAILRAVASGDPELSPRVANFHSAMTRTITVALRGAAIDDDSEVSELEENVSFLLQQVWFASLVGWSSGLHSRKKVVEQMRVAAELLLRGMTDMEND
ncbi:MAG: TetR/AcrR family transcriptional regulator [Deltaproteobacteria bacterium]|jgi:TetR/AcrR family transcriptional regulator, cholesterol catabolism regulator|nr:TetR/AcrR family transcriptional regulator [Deltaproteobacteria bacterium]MBT6436021.1 TetR/AcrR family transcriptional regulator [Deltaproteobacteria bacterium]MBT6492047.1 TetR/AcrR family transcriptional regulator [Deltaproteobacteria bacterium]